MQAILHVSYTATQEIVDHLNQIFSLSQPLIKEAVSDILQRNASAYREFSSLSPLALISLPLVIFLTTNIGHGGTGASSALLYYTDLQMSPCGASQM
ncbi:hypothetical protein F7725_013512 [Dissostichus mawsoni]|uniref:Uncharacterized protein n=1 Tax=Dissostichus mawsoni TaxID=36200 RepID=A0A7J5Y558_DISMA|nr:hypothetical protein F7725_013512 [Dissostichus mawsoni]